VDRRLRYLDGVLIPVNGTVRGKGGLRPAFFFSADTETPLVSAKPANAARIPGWLAGAPMDRPDEVATSLPFFGSGAVFAADAGFTCW
jgi:hypothetical protein